MKEERPIIVEPKFEVIVPPETEKKNKWYETVWGIIVGITVVAGGIVAIIALLKEFKVI